MVGSELLNAQHVLYYPEGSKKWIVREQPDPGSNDTGLAQHGTREMVTEARVLNGIRWLHLASGGWVRERHPDHMSMRFPDKPEVEGYYGWHLGNAFNDEELMTAVTDTRVAVPLRDAVTGAVVPGCCAFSQMIHNDDLDAYEQKLAELQAAHTEQQQQQQQ